MSTISDIYGSYRDALNFSRSKYGEMYTARAENAQEFYKAFLNRLVCDFKAQFSDAAERRILHRHIERFFGSDTIDFVAIDGHNEKKAFQDFIVFAACAYGAKGHINLSNEPPTIQYQKWTIEKDVSMVTYIPVPFSQFADVIDQDQRETFLVSDNEKIDLSSIDTRMMELAEVYLAYNVASSSILERPRLIMLDRSPSSMIADVAMQPSESTMRNYPFDRRLLTVEDKIIAFSHPFNAALRVPSAKRFQRHAAILAEFHRRNSHRIKLDEVARHLRLSENEIIEVLKFIPFVSQDGEWLVSEIDCPSS